MELAISFPGITHDGRACNLILATTITRIWRILFIATCPWSLQDVSIQNLSPHLLDKITCTVYMLLALAILDTCSPPALPPYPHQTAWPPQASSSIYPTLKT